MLCNTEEMPMGTVYPQNNHRLNPYTARRKFTYKHAKMYEAL